MIFLCAFLLLVPTLTLAQSEDLSNLKYFVEANYTFYEIDTNDNNLLELNELVASFDLLKEDEDDSEIKKEWFVQLLNKDGTSEGAAGKLFDEYDTDHNGVLNVSDYEGLQELFDRNQDGEVTPNEFIKSFNKLLADADAEVIFRRRRR